MEKLIATPTLPFAKCGNLKEFSATHILREINNVKVKTY